MEQWDAFLAGDRTASALKQAPARDIDKHGVTTSLHNVPISATSTVTYVILWTSMAQ